MFFWQVQRLIGRSVESVKFPPMTKLLYVSPLDASPEKGPWCFPPPPGNQWLIPVRSPSEGLVYKPYPGPCFPSIGIVNTDGQSCFPGYPLPLHKHKETDTHALALFPTTPDVLNHHKVQVIKVVPYTRDSTPASTARILHSLQQGRTTTNHD